MDTLFIIKYKNIVDIWWTPVFSEQLKKWGYPQKFYPGEYPRFFWTTEIVGATPIFAILLLFLFGDFMIWFFEVFGLRISGPDKPEFSRILSGTCRDTLAWGFRTFSYEIIKVTSGSAKKSDLMIDWSASFRNSRYYSD